MKFVWLNKDTLNKRVRACCKVGTRVVVLSAHVIDTDDEYPIIRITFQCDDANGGIHWTFSFGNLNKLSKAEDERLRMYSDAIGYDLYLMAMEAINNLLHH